MLHRIRQDKQTPVGTTRSGVQISIWVAQSYHFGVHQVV